MTERTVMCDEHKRRIGDANRGKKRTDAQRAALSLVRKEQWARKKAKEQLLNEVK
ncbi:MAG: hypothetical protein V9H25_06505 [Candidatus Competibacter sp.]